MKYISIAIVALMSQQATASIQRGAPTIGQITGTNTGPTPANWPRKMPDMSVLDGVRPKLPKPESPECNGWWDTKLG